MQKFLRTLTLLALLSVPWVAQGQTLVTIGDETSTTTEYTLPVNMFYHYSLTQQIYTASEIGMAGLITSIAFDYTYGTSFSMSGVQVYMKNVSKTGFTSTTDMEPVSASDLVWTGTFTANASGWVTIQLNTPFVYDGSSNLLVCLYDPTNGYPGNSYKFRTTATTGSNYLALAYYSDSYTPSLTDISSFSGNTGRYQYRNNIKLGIAPLSGYCPRPGGFAARNITTTSATLGWSIPATFDNVSSVSVEYGLQGFTPGTGTAATVDGDSAVLTDLSPATVYQAFAVSDCDNDGGSDTSWITFRTKALPVVDIPYTTGFEPTDDLGWEFNNGTNGWFIDTAVHHTGSYSLYISNDNGVHNAYSHTATNSYAYREFVLPSTGDYMLSFDWKANGESSSYDYLEAYLAPSSTDFSGTVNTTGWVNLGRMNLSTTWQHAEYVLGAEANASCFLVFRWYNDNSGGNQPPAAVDNVSVSIMPCSRPTDFEVTDATTTSITLDWTAISGESAWQISVNNDSSWVEVTSHPLTIDTLQEATFYTFYLRADCGTDSSHVISIKSVTACQPTTLPYVQTFDSLSTGTAANFDPCWVKGTNLSTAYPYVSTTNSNNALYAVVSSDTGYAYAILPELDASVDVSDMEMTFNIKASSTSYNGRVIVAMLPSRTFDATTEYDTVAVVSVEGNTTYQMRNVPFINYTGNNRNVALIFTKEGGSTNGVYIDTLNLHQAPACMVPFNLAITEVDTTSVSISFEGLSGQSFKVKIVSDSNYADSAVISSFEHTFYNLTPFTRYTVTVAQECTDGYSESVSLTFKTPVVGSDLPYSTGFETDDDNNWYIDNTGATNKWCIGNATNNGGSRALYISNNNGVSNAYSNTTSYAYAFKAVNCNETGLYAVSFDWKAQGESLANYDMIRAFVMPASSSFVSGASSGINGTTLPNGWQAIDGGSSLHQQTTWHNQTGTFTVSNPGVYYVVFYWYNDASSGENPPAAIDNVQIMRMSCPAPTALHLDSIHAADATISWHSGAAETQWIVRANNGANNGEWMLVEDSSYTFTGLTPSSDYRFEVAAYCGADDTSFVQGVNGRTTDLCNPVTGLSVSNITYASAHIKWTNVPNISWAYEFGPAGFEPGDGTTGTADVDSVDLIDLEAGTTYEFRMWSVCDAGNGPTAIATFTTRGLPISEFPYSTGFELTDDNAWDIINGTNNAWVIGNAAHNGGSRSLYISNDGGTSNSYSPNTSMSYAYRTFIIPEAKQYFIGFDWRAEGESNYDFLRAWITPATATYTANQLPNGTTSPSSYTTTTPEGWIDLGGKMNLQETWQHAENFVDLAAGQYNLVFLWASDVSGAYDPAVAVDNVQFSEVTCARPVAIVVDSLGSDAVRFHWSPAGEETSFEVVIDTNDPVIVTNDTTYLVTALQPLSSHTVAIRAICAVGDTSVYVRGGFRTTCGPVTTLPYYEDFEAYTASTTASIDSCWTKGTNSTTAYPYPSTTNAVEGTKSLYFYATSTIYSYAALPAFTTPVNQLMMTFKVRRYSNSSNTTKLLVGVMSDPNDISTFETVSTVDLTNAALGSINEVEVFFNGYTGNGRYIAILDGVNSVTSYAYVDSVVVETSPACVRPMNISLAAVDGNSATVNVMAAADANLVYVLRQGNTVVDSSAQVGTTRTYTGLTPNTQYTLSVATLCPDGLTEFYTSTFKTTYLGVDLPYSTGFEGTDANGWYVENGTYTNKWTIGSATNNGGSNALYISDDNGASNNYGITTTANVFAFKTFNVPAGQYGVTFDWKAAGEVGYDYLRAFLIPGEVEITAAQNGIGATDTPTGWIALDDNTQMNNASDWQNVVKVFNVPTAGVYNLAFFWHNDLSMGTQPPAAVDNVQFKAITCPMPKNFVVDSITATEAWFHWKAGAQETSWSVAIGNNAPVVVTDTFYHATGLDIATVYQVHIAAVCGVDDISFNLNGSFVTECAPFPIPFAEDFENRATMADLRCWNYGAGSDSQYPRLTYLTGNHNDRLLMMFKGSYFVTPEVVADLSTLELSMSYQTGGDSNYLAIGYLDSLSQAVTDSIFVDTLWAYNYPISGLGHRVYRLLSDAPATAKHVVIKSAPSGTNYYDFFGYVKLALPRTCFYPETIELTASTATSATLSWTVTEGSTPSGYQIEYGPRFFTQGNGTTLTSSTPSITINNLDNTIPYEAYVRSICGAGDTSEWSLAYEFSAACAPLNIPKQYNFEEYAVVGSTYGARLPNCWVFDSASVDTANTNYLPSMYNSNSNIIFYMDAANAVVSLPQFTADFDTLMLSFYMETGSADEALVVGTVASQSGAFGETFEPVDTLRYADNGYVEVFMTSYTGTNQHIAFKNINLANGDEAEVYIDTLRILRAPTCYPVRHLAVTDFGMDYVTLDWNDVIPAGSWNVEYGPVGFVPGAGTTVSVMAHPATVSNLTTNTVYDFYVTPVCSATDHGATAGPVTRRTTCAPVALPFVENFDSYTTVTSPANTGITPGCWDYIMTNPSYSSASYVPQVYYGSTYAISGRYSLRLYGVGYTMLPPMPTSLDSLMLSFSHYKSSSYYDLEVGVMEGNTFVPVQTITTPSSTRRQVNVYFNNYHGNSRIIAFRNSYGTYGYSYHYIDSVVVDYMPPCPQVMNVHSVAAGTTTVTVDWTTLNNNATSWQVEIGAAGHTLGAASATRTIVNSHPVTLRGLDTATAYDVYVRPICSASDTGVWSDVATVFTSICDGARIVSTGTPTGTSYYAPVNNFYKYTLTETILDSAEMARMGSTAIEKIGYSYNYSTASTSKTDVTIWLQPTNKSVFSSSNDLILLDTSIAVQVYSGNLNCSQGWNYFDLSTPYQWDGHSNIVVIVDDNSNAYNSSSHTFNTSSCTGYKTLYWYSDTQDPSPTSSSYSGSTGYVQWRPTMQLLTCGQACEEPTTVNATATDNTVVATWSGNGDTYEVAIVEGNNWIAPEVGGEIVNDTTYTFTGLEPETQYIVGVRTVCDDDLTSDWVTYTITTEVHPCAVPTNLVASNVTLNSATLGWTNGEEGQSAWQIHITGEGYDQTHDVTTNPFTVTGLAYGVTYTFTVRAVCTQTNISAWSAPATFTTVACESVTGVTVGSLTANSAVISWTAPTGATRFVVNYGLQGFDQGTGSFDTVTNTTCTLTGLSANTPYDVYVRTLCEGGTASAWSSVVNFTTSRSTGIDDVNAANVSLYPNPASSTVTLKGIEGKATVTVVDMNGRKAGEWTVNEGELTIDVTDMAQGAYFVRIVGEQVNAIRKLIVR